METNAHQNRLINTAQEKIFMILSNQTTPVDFVEWYENWYLDDVESMEKFLDKKIFVALQELYNDMGYFEANDEICKEASCYFGVDKLQNKLRRALGKIENRLNKISSC